VGSFSFPFSFISAPFIAIFCRARVLRVLVSDSLAGVSAFLGVIRASCPASFGAREFPAAF